MAKTSSENSKLIKNELLKRDDRDRFLSKYENG